MPAVSLGNLLAVLAIAFGAPLLLGLVPRVRIPSSVVEIVTGIVVGPSVLGWVEVDEPVRVLATIGLAFVLFLTGLEVDLMQLRGPSGSLVIRAFAGSLAIAAVSTFALREAGLLESPLFVAIALTATAPTIVIPVLRDAALTAGTFGRLVLAAVAVSCAGSAVLLSVFYSRSGAGAGTRAVLLGAFALLVVAIALALSGVRRHMWTTGVFLRLQDTTAQIRIRATVLLLVGIVVASERSGLEVVLSAFVAGAVLRLIDRDAQKTHPHYFVKLDAIGYGFLAPIFFVASGLRFDADALVGSASTLVRVPVFLAALLVVRGLPAMMYRSALGNRDAVAAGLLQATSLTFIVAAAQIGTELGTISQATGAAMLAAGLLSAVVFPPIALALLRVGPVTGEASGETA